VSNGKAFGPVVNELVCLPTLPKTPFRYRERPTAADSWRGRAVCSGIRSAVQGVPDFVN